MFQASGQGDPHPQSACQSQPVGRPLIPSLFAGHAGRRARVKFKKKTKTTTKNKQPIAQLGNLSSQTNTTEGLIDFRGAFKSIITS